MKIKNVNTIEELDTILKYVIKIFPFFPQNEDSNEKYSRNFWIERLNYNSELFLYAEIDDSICGSVFGWSENQSITVGHCFVLEEYRGKGIGKALMQELEKRVKETGYNSIVLGSIENAEGFYAKLGYKGMLLIQSEKDSIKDLRSINNSFEEIATNLYDGYINQLYLQIPLSERNIQKKYRKHFSACTTQMVFSKRI